MDPLPAAESDNMIIVCQSTSVAARDAIKAFCLHHPGTTCSVHSWKLGDDHTNPHPVHLTFIGLSNSFGPESEYYAFFYARTFGQAESNLAFSELSRAAPAMDLLRITARPVLTACDFRQQVTSTLSVQDT